MGKTGRNPDGIISDKQEILAELIASKESGNFLGIWAPCLGDGVFICSIENIHDGYAENDKVIIVKEKSLQGKSLQTNVIYLNEIEKVHRFKTL